jgi:hypothetical protein
MGYLNNFLGVRCWRCKQGQVELFDKNDGVYLACSCYPASCQFVSASPIQCPNCAGGSLLSKFEENILYLVHEQCGFKSAAQAFDNEASELKDTGILIDYLTTLSFEEINQLWDSEVWESSDGLPIPDSLDQLTVKETIQKIRSVKWKLLNKKL